MSWRTEMSAKQSGSILITGYLSVAGALIYLAWRLW